jgi:hypothetical protein
MKKLVLILITFLSFCISSVSYSKIEKTKLDFSIDVPADYILLSRDNYSQFKELLTRTFTKNIKKEDYDKEVENLYKKFTEGRTGNYFVIIPNWGNSWAYSEITFYKQTNDRVVPIDKLSLNKKTLTEFCNEFNDVLTRKVVNFKVEKCSIDRKKFKKFDKFLHLKAKYTKKDKIFESYFIDYKDFQIKVEILVHKQDYERIEGSLRYMIDTIN